MRTYGNVIRRIIATLLLIIVSSLGSGATISTKAPADNARPAAISTIGRLAPQKTRRRAASANLYSPQSSIGAVTSEPDAKPRIATELARVPLDLRPPDLQSILAQLTPEAMRRARADEALPVTIVGTSLRPEERLYLMRTGIGSIYWAARHPAQVWKVLLPIVPNDGSAVSEDIKAACDNVRPLGGHAACP